MRVTASPPEQAGSPELAGSSELAERPVLGGPERAGLRTQVEAEIARRRPKPVAMRTLHLLAEASVELSPTPPGYRIVDRHGLPRLHADSDAPLTLSERIDEIQARHPALFLPPEAPDPVAEAPEKDTSLMAGAAEMRAATARFVETGSERARLLAERSTEQGRALAESAAGRVSGIRAGLAAWLAERRAEPSSSSSPSDRGAPAWQAGANRLGASTQAGLGTVAARLRGWQGEGESVRQHRRWLAGGTVAALVAVLAAGLVVANRPTEEPSATPTRTAPTTAEKAAAPDPVTPPPETADTAEMPEPPAPPAANEIRGPAEVIDTATVRVNGKLMHLFGVEWVRGGQADELTKYLAGRAVACVPAAGSENFSCAVEGRDLSEVVLFNGGGRASPEASPELVAAEDHARTERLGVWKR